MATKRVLDVGNCGPDHAAIRDMIESQFDAAVLQAHDAADTIAILNSQPIDLVLVNRQLDQDGSDGLDIIQQLKANSKLRDLPVMLITNYEDQQQAAMQAGALRGFGKRSLKSASTLSSLQKVLG